MKNCALCFVSQLPGYFVLFLPFSMSVTPCASLLICLGTRYTEALQVSQGVYCYANALKDHTIPYYSAALAADNPYSSSVKPRDISTIPGFPVIAKVEQICHDKDLATSKGKQSTLGQSEHLDRPTVIPFLCLNYLMNI